MKKIHCYISSLEGGGAERQMVYLSSFLAEAGYDVTLITLLDAADKYELASNIKRICLNYRLGDNLLLKLIKKIKIFFFFLNLKSDCIISFLIGSNVQVLNAMRFRPKVKVIISERNLVTWDLSEYERNAYCKLYKRANYVVSNNYSMEKYLASLNPALRPNLRTILNYADLNIYKVTPLPLKEKLIIGVFARFQRQKNYERFAEMLKCMKGVKHRPFLVKWYGDKKTSCYLHFCQIIEKYQIGDLIELNDFVSDVPQEMESIDMVCLPSMYEGFSNSLAEAICCGKPVIAGKVSDNSTMVENGVNGFLFDPEDTFDMTNVFCKLVNTRDDELIEMSKNSRAIAERLFDKLNFVNSYKALIDN